MRRFAALVTAVFVLFGLFVPLGASELGTVISPADLSDRIGEGGEIISLSEDMTFDGETPGLYINRNLVIRSSDDLPVTLTEGRFTVVGDSVEPVTVVFENINFISEGASTLPAVYVTGNVKVTFSGCTFKGYADGGVRISAEDDDTLTATFKNCLFESNVSCGHGGGVCAVGRGSNLTLNATGCVFDNNGALTGGGLFFEGATVTLTGCTFTFNGSEGEGGGLSGTEGRLTLNNCVFGDNLAKGYGGGIYLYDVKLTMLDCVVAKNDAQISGGGLWIEEVFHDYDSVKEGLSPSVDPEEDEAIPDDIPVPDRNINIDNCSFYLNSVSGTDSDTDISHGGVGMALSGQNDVNIRLSTFAYHEGEQTLYHNPYIDFFGCILEGDGLSRQMPSAENGYCLIYDEDGSVPTIDSEYRLSDCPHLNCVNDDPALRIPIEAVKEAYGTAFSGYYGAFPVGDNCGEVELVFPFFPLRTETVKATRGTPIAEIPAPMRDMYAFGGWYLPDGNRLAGYRLLVGGDVDRIEFSPLWTHNTKYYLTLAGCGFAMACGVTGWIVVKRRMKKVVSDQ